MIPSPQERQRAAAAVHIQRVARGHLARKVAASVTISRDIPALPLPPLQTPKSEAKEQHHRDSEKDGGGLASPLAAKGNDDGAAEPAEDGGDESLEGRPGTVPTGLSGEVDGEEELTGPADGSPESADQQREPSPAAVLSKTEEVARTRAASKIQVRHVRFASEQWEHTGCGIATGVNPHTCVQF